MVDGLLEPAVRLTAAVVAGGVVGLNRDLYGKPTGFAPMGWWHWARRCSLWRPPILGLLTRIAML